MPVKDSKGNILTPFTKFRFEVDGEGFKDGKYNGGGNNHDIDFTANNELWFYINSTDKHIEVGKYYYIGVVGGGYIDGYYEWVVHSKNQDYSVKFDSEVDNGYYMYTDKKAFWGKRQGSIYNGDGETRLKFVVHTD